MARNGTVPLTRGATPGPPLAQSSPGAVAGTLAAPSGPMPAPGGMIPQSPSRPVRHRYQASAPSRLRSRRRSESSRATSRGSLPWSRTQSSSAQSGWS